VLPARNGWETYFAILTDSRYASSLVNTLLLSIVVTVTTLALGLAVGLYLAKPQVIGRRFLLSLLTLPLSFPGVVVGFLLFCWVEDKVQLPTSLRVSDWVASLSHMG